MSAGLESELLLTVEQSLSCRRRSPHLERGERRGKREREVGREREREGEREGREEGGHEKRKMHVAGCEHAYETQHTRERERDFSKNQPNEKH